MPSQMDWSHDFCLSCDKQTSEGPYCSQACRLADLEKAGASEPVSPAWNFSSPSEASSSWHSQPSHSKPASSQFQLQPAVNFAAYRSRTSRRIESPPPSPRSSAYKHSHHLSAATNGARTAPAPAPSSRAQSDYPQIRTRGLYSSSSRSSLSSISSNGTAQGLSDQALMQLRIYSNSFDHVRDWKRRVTLG